MKKVLFIEDEEDLQKTFGEILSQKYEIIQALDGSAGLELANSEKPDLILLDLILPKINGFEVLETLKKNEETKNIPIIVLTNLEQPESVEKAIGLGATTYLVKAQYELSEVMEKVKKAIEE